MTKDDLIFVKSQNVTDTSSNGGRMSYNPVLNRVRFNIFPRVTKSERSNGITRYRKIFLWNKESANEPAFAPLVYLIHPTPATGERVYLAKGTDTDTQNDITTNPNNYIWTGAGQLSSDVSAGATTINVDFESNDYFINNEMYVVLNSHFLVDEPVDSGVSPFVQVYWNGSKWIAQSAPTSDQEDTYPYGTCLSVDSQAGTGTIFSYNSNGHLEFHQVAHSTSVVDANEAADGSRTSFTFTPDASSIPLSPYHVSVTVTIRGSQYTGTDDGNGTISGSNISGTVDYDTGAISITTSLPPDNGTAVQATVAKRNVTWSGNTATIMLDTSLSNSFTASNTYVAVCFAGRDLTPAVTVDSISSTGGSVDTNYISVSNVGTVYDTWTFTFTSSTQFSCSGSYTGSVGTGDINSTFAPTNTDQNAPYFTIETNFWSGTWTSGDSVVIITTPSSQAYWLKEVVDAGAAAFQYNYFILETYVE